MARVRILVNVGAASEERRIALAALKPELASLNTRRTSANLSQDENNLRLEIMADDIVAARAAANSFIRLLDIALGAREVVSSVVG
ncbi:MAG: KEOPS complex subunit Pcc1 [Aigarchaeota archaeon]|nr:KEOPS complex subunit Pcc1 [Candidatus Pelearchaeum maunauluense]